MTRRLFNSRAQLTPLGRELLRKYEEFLMPKIRKDILAGVDPSDLLHLLSSTTTNNVVLDLGLFQLQLKQTSKKKTTSPRGKK